VFVVVDCDDGFGINVVDDVDDEVVQVLLYLPGSYPDPPATNRTR
jgi:hypothetical protein